MHGNFGDEVMAIMIARVLRSHGFQPVVYKLPRYLADPEGFETVDSLGALADGISACVLGGGGLLVPASEGMTPAVAMFDEEVRQLGILCASRAIPVWGVSVGGTGTGRHEKLYPGLASFFASGVVCGLTRRLGQDGPLVDAFNIPSEHYPDIVFLAPDYWPPTHANQRRDIVITNTIAHYWVGRRLIHLLDALGPTVFGVEPRHVRTRNVHCPEDAGHSVGRIDRHVPYVTIQELADLASRTRAVISSKLHLGIFGMSYGALFFSYGEREKTRAQLRELGLASHRLATRDLPGWLLRLRTRVDDDLEATAHAVCELRTRARGHVTSLLSFLRSQTGRGKCSNGLGKRG